MCSIQPVSRSTSELLQLEVCQQPSEKMDKPDKQDSKLVKPVSLETVTVTGQSPTPDEQVTSDTQKQVLPVKPEQAGGGDDGEVVQGDGAGGDKLAVEDGEDKEAASFGVLTTEGHAEEEEDPVPAISVGRVSIKTMNCTCMQILETHTHTHTVSERQSGGLQSV